MIHEFKEEFLDLPLEDFILTFDDGLYSQYKYLKELKALKTPKVFFISTNLVRPPQMAPSDEFLACGKAHEKAFNGNLENYMSWDEITEIYKSPWCEIGGHGHNHLRLEDIDSIRERYNAIAKDTEAMLTEFNNHNIAIKSFCYPYNNEDPLLGGVLKRKGIEFIYGNTVQYLNTNRIAIEDLEK